MPTEYHLQKRGLAIWQYVTWYETYEEAKKNFDGEPEIIQIKIHMEIQ